MLLAIAGSDRLTPVPADSASVDFDSDAQQGYVRSTIKQKGDVTSYKTMQGASKPTATPVRLGLHAPVL
jgi:hypothetical protein